MRPQLPSAIRPFENTIWTLYISSLRPEDSSVFITCLFCFLKLIISERLPSLWLFSRSCQVLRCFRNIKLKYSDTKSFVFTSFQCQIPAQNAKADFLDDWRHPITGTMFGSLSMHACIHLGHECHLSFHDRWTIIVHCSHSLFTHSNSVHDQYGIYSFFSCIVG